MSDFSGKTCLITGGAGSLGMAAAIRFHGQGANLSLIDVDFERLRAAAKEAFGRVPDNVLLIAADVSDEDDARRYVGETVDRFGGISVLFSNAGNAGVVAPIQDYPTAAFDAVYRVHVRGAFLAAKYAVPHMASGASIVIASSVAARRGDPGVHGYITMKHAQTGLMRCLAKELAPKGIRVNSLNPGPIDNAFQKGIEDGLGAELGVDGTELFNRMIPMGRHGSPDEVAKMVTFLASDDSSFSTGGIFTVDGGMSI